MRQLYYYPSTRIEKFRDNSVIIVILFDGVILTDRITNSYIIYCFRITYRPAIYGGRIRSFN